MVAAVKFDQFTQNIGRGVHNLNTDSLKIVLSNTAPNGSTNQVLADITQIAAGNGYSTGGTAVGATAYSQTAGTASLTGSNVTFTASGGAMATFRYVILYDDTPTSPADPLIQYWDNGSTVTLNSGDTFTVSFGASILTVS